MQHRARHRRSARALAALAAALTVTAQLSLPGAAGAAPAACGPSFSDRLTDVPWPLERLHPEQAWPMTRGDGVVVAVIDSGVSTTPPSLAQQVLAGKDYVAGNAGADCDKVAHGTFVAAIIAGLQLPGTGFYGVAPGAKILPIRVLEDDSKSYDQNLPNTIADAVDYAVDHGAGVINLSLVTLPTPRLADAVARALSRNVVVVAAAGNDGASQNAGQPAYPASYPGVIGVAGTDEGDHRVATSTPGSFVDVGAPGVRIQGPAPQGGGFGMRASGGTSFAAPYVSGTAALLKAYYPSLTPQQIADRITATADHPPTGRDDEVGYGTVNPYRAVSALLADAPAARAAVDDHGLGPAGAPGRDRSSTPAIWTAFAAVMLAALVWAGLFVQRARRRPATPPPASPAQRTARRDDSVDGALRVRGPAVRRGTDARTIAAIERRGVSLPTTTTGTDRRSR